MRTNLPVTNTEVEIKDGELIVSRTDLKGRITYINKTFLDVSGFTEQELIGEPHNIVRHPDMPPEAYKDLWETLKAGKPWTGYVKNRCKSGDFYWVVANATPIWENGSLAGYMSVRKRAERSAIEEVEKAYRLFREGKANGLTIREGKIVKTTLVPRVMDKLANLTIKIRFALITGILSVLLVTIGGVGLYGINKTEAGLKTVYADRAVPMGQLYSIVRNLMSNRLNMSESLLHPNPNNISRRLADTEKNIADISRTWDAYMSTYLTPEEKVLAGKFAEARGRFVKDGLRPIMAALKEGKLDHARQINDKLDTLFDPTREHVNALLQLQLDVAEQEFETAEARYEFIRNAAIASITLGIVLALWLSWVTYRAIVLPLNRVRDQMREIALGNMNLTVRKDRNDEVGEMADSFRSLFIKMGFDMSEANRRADEMSRIKVALDSVGTCVTVSDEKNTLIYMNRSGERLFDILAEDRGGAKSLMGTKLGDFLEDPEVKTQFVRELTQPILIDGVVSGRVMRIEPGPVRNEKGEYLGRVTQWTDRTEESLVEQEVAEIVEAAASGDFSRRIDLDGKSGFFKSLAEGVNRFVHETENGLNQVVAMLHAISEGDLSRQMEGNYGGTFGQLKVDANATVDKLREIVSSIRESTGSINTAAGEIAAGNADLSARTESQAASIEETAASMEELTSTVKMNAENAHQASQLSFSATDVAVHGGEVVGQVVETMGTIAESSKKIADIISVIDGIAFQTNILALNAAVEAARAGEQGRGFAVVAGEVRNLAQRSAAAAKEIKELIQDSVGKVENGHQLVARAGETMKDVVESIRKVSDIMTEISSASNEQSSGIEQVNLAMAQMDEAVQQNAALVEEAAAAAKSMEDQAGNLVEAVSIFKLGSEPQAWDGKAERRSASRATNVERLSSRASGSSGQVATRRAASGGGEGDWDVF